MATLQRFSGPDDRAVSEDCTRCGNAYDPHNGDNNVCCATCETCICATCATDIEAKLNACDKHLAEGFDRVKAEWSSQAQRVHKIDVATIQYQEAEIAALKQKLNMTAVGAALYGAPVSLEATA